MGITEEPETLVAGIAEQFQQSTSLEMDRKVSRVAFLPGYLVLIAAADWSYGVIDASLRILSDVAGGNAAGCSRRDANDRYSRGLLDVRI
jgi:hypothetical protein